MKILVIEDDPGIREVICEALRFSSFECLPYQEGKTALEYIIQNPNIDFLIFLNLVMPGMSGWEFLQRVDRLRLKTRIRIVVVTGLYPSQRALADKHVDQVLKKPFSLDSILKCVNEFEHDLKKAA